MRAQALKTRIFKKNEALLPFLIEALPGLSEGSLLVITSKLLSLSQGRFLPCQGISKKEIVACEADRILVESYRSYITLKDGFLLPAAGIDESNAGDSYILWPLQARLEAQTLYGGLKEHFGLEHFGLLFSDSRSSPLRRGVTGLSIAHYGFKGLKSHVGKKDLFGKALEMAVTNVTDCLASTAILLMGESNEQRPLCLFEDVELDFIEGSDAEEINVPFENDMFGPLFRRELF